MWRIIEASEPTPAAEAVPAVAPVAVVALGSDEAAADVANGTAADDADGFDVVECRGGSGDAERVGGAADDGTDSAPWLLALDVARWVRVTSCFVSGDADAAAEAATVVTTVVAGVVAKTVAVLPLRALPALSGRSSGVFPTAELPMITVVGTVVAPADVGCTGDGAVRLGVVVPDVFPGDDSVLGRREGLALTDVDLRCFASSCGDVGVNAEPSSSQSSSPMLNRRRLLLLWPCGLGSADGGAATTVAVVGFVVVYTAGVLMAACDNVSGGRALAAEAAVAVEVPAAGGIGVMASSRGFDADAAGGGGWP